MRGKIAVIGSSNVDLIMQIERLPIPGETVTGGKFHQTNGGKGANQAVGAARAGAEVTFISSLGADSFASNFLARLKEDSINTDYIIQKEGLSTGTALIMIDAQAENCIAVAPGANYALNKHHIDKAEAILATADLILIQCEILPETIHYIIQKADSLGKRLVLNLAPAYALPTELLSLVDLLIVNESEAALLSNLPVRTLEEAQKASVLLEQKVRGEVILTLGAKGSLVTTAKEQFAVDAFNVDAIDTTGAGDVYCGSLAAALVNGMDLREAVRFASAASALAVTRLGAQTAAPYLKEIEALLNRNN